MRLRLSRLTAFLFLLAIVAVTDPGDPTNLRWVIFTVIMHAETLRYPLVALAAQQLIYELTTPS